MDSYRSTGRAVWVVGICVSSVGAASPPLVRLSGTAFTGGAAEFYGTTHFGTAGVNYVYARSTGGRSVMKAAFGVRRLPAEPQRLHLRGRDDDDATACPIEILLNGSSLFQGPSGFPNDAWAWKSYAIPAGVLKPERNELVIVNRAETGQSGMPPWFMVARAVVGGKDVDLADRAPIEENFFVTLPQEVRPLPEPLAGGHTEPGFKIRGTKGWMWRPEQYLAEIPVLAKYKMNFLMNCYTSMCDVEHFAWGDRRCNRWWEPLPDAKVKGYEGVVRECQRQGIQFCFSMNPNICTNRIVNYDSPEDIDLLWRHYRWMQGLGVKWFNISLDDISEGIDAAGQAKVVNEILRRLRADDPDAQMIFCPTYYWGTGEDPKARAYLAQLARDLDKDVYVFWTGGAVVGPITRPDAETYKGHVKHRIIVWDNYPVNDKQPTMHLGPVVFRDADLGEAVEGIMGNPLCPQNEINRIPLLTLADYAYNPWAYDPARSIGQAIVHLADTPAQRRVLKDLVELYPGTLLLGKGTGWNPVITQFNEIAARPHARYLAELYLGHVGDVARRMAEAFPDRFKAARETIENDVAKMKAAYADRYGCPASRGAEN